ncbi:MAG: hypothetical protein P8N93_05235 [Flavobacteriaceae bacterium]|jgi:hypothetical protein|nr:hypothetical protein [Flavobacteriaceae bacterium]
MCCSLFGLAQKEHFIGTSLGTAKYIDEGASGGTAFSAFYEIKNSPHWVFGVDLNYAFINELPKGLNIGSHSPPEYLNEVNQYFIGAPSWDNLVRPFFYNRDLHATVYANFIIPIKKLKLIPAIGIGYGHISTLHFSLSDTSYDTSTNLITEVRNYNVVYWYKGVVNLGPKVRLLYPINNQTSFYIASKIILNAGYKSDDDFDFGYTGTWSHHFGFRIKI